MRVVAHHDEFEEGTLDADWLPVVGSKGLVVLTKDQAIRYTPAEKAALQRAGVKQFVLVGGNLTSDQMSEAFLAARPRMERLLLRMPGAFVARVTRTGEISSVIDLSRKA